MLLKNSLKQMQRTKARMIVFLILVILTTAFLSLGVNLWLTCNKNMRKYERAFTTIGLISQKENTVEVSKSWDAATKEYTYWDTPVYDSILPISLLDFKGANYIIKPEHRPIYGAYCPDLYLWQPEQTENHIKGWVSIIEFIPYKDCIPSEPVKVKVTRVLFGSAKAGEDIWLCDHFNENTGSLKAGKTYITTFQSIYNQHSNSDPKAYYESIPYNGTISTQKNKFGKSITDETQSVENWEEVTKSFYETKAGHKWKELVKAEERFIRYTLPVVPTSNAKLLLDFHQGNTYISSGRDITAEEYKNGEKVCIVPLGIATKNNLKIGDKINLQLYFADYERSTSQMYRPSGGITLDFGLLNAKGEAYPVFEDSDYEIVGIYGGVSAIDQPTGYEMGYNEVVIPANSVKNSDENNIVAYGPMKGYTTSFQIPNGTIKKYTEKFKELGIDNLEISLYDGGYEKLASGMRNLKVVALILVATSTATTLAILFFFVFMFITKQKKRTAIERSLGMSKKECTMSLLYGVLGVISAGSVTGSFAGFVITEIVMMNTKTGTEIFSTAFSNWVNNSDTDAMFNAVGSVNPLTTILVCLIVILISYLISLLFIKKNLKTEPLALLSGNEE